MASLVWLYLLIGDVLVIIDIVRHLKVYDEYMDECTGGHMISVPTLIAVAIAIWPIALIMPENN